MDRRERDERLTVSLKALFKGFANEMWTACPGILQSYDPTTNTASVQLAIKPQLQNQDGSWSDANPVPICVDVPVKFFGNSAFVVTIPLVQGDEGLLVFGKNCIDGWWQSGGVQSQIELRVHDLSDAFFLPGIYSKPKVPANISTTSMQMRSADGSTFVEVKSGQIVNVVAPGGINLNGVTIDSSGNVAGIAKLTTTDTYSLGGGAQALKRADGSNTTKGTAT